MYGSIRKVDSFDIGTGLIEGTSPHRALTLLMEWYMLHREDLAMDLNLTRGHQPLKGIAPLEQYLDIVHVVEARAEGGCRLFLRFLDGIEGIADLTSLLWGPIFDPLRGSAAFARFHISPVGALEWENGADLAPEALEDLIKQSRSS
jgi:hypothetical protein